MNTWDSLSRQVKDKSTGAVKSTDTRPVRDVYAQGMMAPQYSALTFPVAAGAHCIYEGELYAAKQAIAASEAWTAAHWDKVQLGAEVAKVGASVTDLKSHLEELLEITAKGFDKTEVTPPLGFAEAMVVASGGISASPNYDARYWTPVNGHKYLSVDYSLLLTNTAIAIGFFNAESASASTIVGYIKSTVADKIYPIPSDAEYIALTVPTGETHKIEFYDNDVLEHISDINEEINEICTFESNGQMINPDTTNVLNGYLADQNSTDTKYNSGSIFRSIYVPIEQNTYYTIQDYVDGNNTKFYRTLGLFTAVPTSGAIGKRMYNTRPVYTFYSGEYSYVVIYIYNSSSDTLTFKEKLEKIKLEKGATATEGFVYGEGKRIVDESNLSNKLKSKVNGAFGFASPYFDFDDSIATGEGLSLTVPNCKKGTLLSFSANISGSFGSIKVGQGNAATNETGYIVVDETNLYVYYYGNSEQLVATKAHGLTIADYIEITIETLSETFNKAKFTISSGGASYSYTDMYLGCSVNAYATSINGTFINCVLTYFCTDWYKKMWLFGDSYFDHWVQYACEKGYVNFLCDGYSGRTSQPAYDSFKKNLAKGTPQYAVWCIGMNNGDNVSSINSTWLTVVSKFIQDCEANGITPILCTIPNVSTVNNNYKNAWIRNSGYRYIELAKMVGSDISTSWYSGLLSNDGVHPSTAGDKMIAMFMVTQLPEMK